MMDRIKRFMAGRYGLDALGRAMLFLAFICLILNMFFIKRPFYILALVLIILCYVRMLSRDIRKRYAENQWFLSKTAFITKWFSKQKNYSEIRKNNYRIFVCPSCKQKVKVPKGKGKISIHCPKCGQDFIKKS